MIPVDLKERLGVLKRSQKIPNVILVTGLYDLEHRKEDLVDLASLLEEKPLSESKGNLIFLESENLQSIKVDEVRDLLKQISLCKWEDEGGRYILIPHAELLTTQSSNALLKTLEEAPQGTHFLLGAAAKRALLKTILSRSLVLNAHDNKKPSVVENVFAEAFFNKDTSLLLKMARADLKYEWQKFQIKTQDDFVAKIYSGNLDQKEWHRLFKFLDELDGKIEANMDLKWIAAAIERFGFNG